MRIDVVTLFPPMFDALTEHGVTGRAVRREILQLALWNPRDFTYDNHRTVDDRPYGGGPGMVMLAQPLHEAVQAARAADPEPAHVVYLSPQGRRLDQAGVEQLAQRRRLLLVAGRYEGIDERFIEAEVDEEWSIGDYVLSGGELAAMVLIDAVARLLPGVLGHESSAAQDSFVGGLLDCPHYTRPEVWEGRAVPEVLLSGDHAAIARWREQQALGRTWLRRPDLLARLELSREQQKLLADFIGGHEQN
ncbi:tRNA (guanosine(37)-N1)-methyltransferase TrmD [Sulfurivermis fontis]|uniref:tRNA (guanosine(37)-N1)-methyltransferase TrmD n=1 Tax=Sulfurivermis fontis TaxID=1972068 RepID=UPI000FD93FBC|nr:tRNA (guanosine(37)-N1)-methyltransferase TrmD [Sulfurivermis fontis]